MDAATQIFTETIIKVEDFLEQMTTLITDHLALNDPSMTVLSHDNLYNMSIIAEWFHLVPHVDIRLRPLSANVTFDPADNEYLESIGILVALPGFWLILTLLFFLIFFLCRCCDGSGNGSSDQPKQFHQQQVILGKTSKPKRMTGCKLCLALVATITGFAITVSLLGSIIAHRGMVKLRNSTTDIANVLETVQNDTQLASIALRDHVDPNVDKLSNALNMMLVKDMAVKKNLDGHIFHLKKNVTKCSRRVDEIFSRVERFNVRAVPDVVHFVERIRWPATLAIAFLQTIFCLILLCGLVRHSRCTLIMFSVFGLLALVCAWAVSAALLGLLVAGSDFCAEPDPVLTDLLGNKADIVLYDYYVRCPLSTSVNGNSPVTNPFRRSTRDSLAALEQMSESIRQLEMLCVSYCSSQQQEISEIAEHLNTAERLMKSAQALLDCRRVHEDMATAMTSSCKDLVEGVFLMLVTSVAIGLLFTLLVLCASHTWIHIRSGSPSCNANSVSAHGSSTLLGGLDNTEETDPFLTSTPHHLHNAHHHTMLSNNSTSSSLTNTSLGGKRFRDSYSSAYGTTTRGRFSHTPPQTPHFSTTLGGTSSNANTSGVVTGGRRSDEQLAFLSPPPAYDQLTQQQQQQLHYQQQQQQHQHIYGTHHTGTLPHPHHHIQQPQMAHHPSAIGHYVPTKYY